ncbi:hypothetical protein Pmani_000457 [Petrolisthes manimaculis]|uniref:Nucleolar protein 16 n=1 Tax=Petrolisthes manimaculis TaxID=1843537 RepID=A0AAE1UQB1_9EUCA|nr:hypothetical protein Pmani_000457 [Petrolisthes manimaculis]
MVSHSHHKPEKRKVKKVSSNPRKRQKQERKRLNPLIPCPIARKAWNDRKSVALNFRNIGLVFNLNKIKPNRYKPREESSDTPRRQRPVRNKSKALLRYEEAIDQANDKGGEDFKIKISYAEIDFAKAMIAEYGVDYEAMSRDTRNYFQETPNQLQARLKKFYRYKETPQAQKRVRLTGAVPKVHHARNKKKKAEAKHKKMRMKIKRIIRKKK